ncbi:conserved membrane hypothetical protein [Rubrivivax sp. A210]|uniref:hypothetical protein n=1 Tax=Rubrivivax sp. A210 TaxID=2772301 RepID=UPI001917FF20|nr:hypothetical protein [Rubrivivax sp. A210]CAD5373735.1 conserved membrane hypothetical protein [Rubrivivax sp. A210]
MRKFQLTAALVLALFSATAMAETQEPGSAAQALKNITEALGTYVAVLAGTGGLVVALLEAYKKLFSIRGKYHRTAVIRWLSQDSAKIPAALMLAKPGLLSSLALGGGSHYDVPGNRAATAAGAQGTAYDAAQAYAEFFHLTSGQAQPPQAHPSHAVLRWRGVDRAVFELETARMMSQIQDAADAVLNNPDLYPHFYAFLTRGSGADATLWRSYLAAPPAAGPTKQDSDRYGRVRMLVRRQLDAFQTVTTRRWEDLNQWWAMLLGALILFVAFVMAADPGFAGEAFDPWRSWTKGWGALGKEPGTYLGVLLKAALGGALAPIAKDLLSSLSSIKFTK